MTTRIGYIVLCAALLFVCWRADTYKNRIKVLEAERASDLARMAEEVSQADAARARAVAEAERAAREKAEKDAARMAALAAKLSDTRAALVRERKAFDARLKAVSLAAAHECRGLSSEWVQLYNTALGLGSAGSGAGASGEDTGITGTHAPAGEAGTSDTGVRHDALATPEDILAHVRDYGTYCRSLEAQIRALVQVQHDS